MSLPLLRQRVLTYPGAAENIINFQTGPAAGQEDFWIEFLLKNYAAVNVNVQPDDLPSEKEIREALNSIRLLAVHDKTLRGAMLLADTGFQFPISAEGRSFWAKGAFGLVSRSPRFYKNANNAENPKTRGKTFENDWRDLELAQFSSMFVTFFNNLQSFKFFTFVIEDLLKRTMILKGQYAAPLDAMLLGFLPPSNQEARRLNTEEMVRLHNPNNPTLVTKGLAEMKEKVKQVMGVCAERQTEKECVEGQSEIVQNTRLLLAQDAGKDRSQATMKKQERMERQSKAKATTKERMETMINGSNPSSGASANASSTNTNTSTNTSPTQRPSKRQTTQTQTSK